MLLSTKSWRSCALGKKARQLRSRSSWNRSVRMHLSFTSATQRYRQILVDAFANVRERALAWSWPVAYEDVAESRSQRYNPTVQAYPISWFRECARAHQHGIGDGRNNCVHYRPVRSDVEVALKYAPTRKPSLMVVFAVLAVCSCPVTA